jgi:diadenosine tetraphosphate (Ap4A) HIT family hydrolase
LSKSLDVHIIPRWKRRKGYPKRYDPVKTTLEEDEKRLLFFMATAREDTFASTRFFTPLE